MSTQPTDAELKAMWQPHAADIGGISYYARAKWGTPAQAAEPVAWLRNTTGQIADYVADNWPMRKYDPSEIEQRSRMLASAPSGHARGPLTDEQTKALMQAHRTAMLMTCKARAPECGEFAAIAQDLDWLCESFGIKGGQHGTDT